MKKVSTVALVFAFAASAAMAEWTLGTSTDAFGEKTSDRYVSSHLVESVRPMSSPYQGTRAWLYVNCGRVAIGFTKGPNLTGGKFLSTGGKRYGVSVRIDGTDATKHILADNGGRMVYFNAPTDFPRSFASELAQSSSLAVSFSWYGQSLTAFKWSLDGLADVVDETCEASE